MSTCAACLKRRVEEPAASVEVRSNALSEGVALLQCDSSHFYASGGFQPTALVSTATASTAMVPTTTGRRCMPISLLIS